MLGWRRLYPKTEKAKKEIASRWIARRVGPRSFTQNNRKLEKVRPSSHRILPTNHSWFPSLTVRYNRWVALREILAWIFSRTRKLMIVWDDDTYLFHEPRLDDWQTVYATTGQRWILMFTFTVTVLEASIIILYLFEQVCANTYLYHIRCSLFWRVQLGRVFTVTVNRKHSAMHPWAYHIVISYSYSWTRYLRSLVFMSWVKWFTLIQFQKTIHSH